MRLRVWMFSAAGVSAILTAGCGSVVRSTEEASPPPSGAKMEGLAYWLPKGAIVIEGTWDKDTSDLTITIAPFIDADTSSCHYRLTRKVNHLFEDNVTLEVDTTTGLLQTVNGTSEDKTAAIAAEGIAIAAKAMTFGVGGGVTGTRSVVPQEKPTPTPPPCGQLVSFTGSFRYMIPSFQLPTNETYATRRTLVVSSGPPASGSKANGNPTATATPTPMPPVTKTYCVIVRRKDKHDEYENSRATRINNPAEGIVVRAPAPYLVTMRELDRNTDTQRIAEQLLFLPDTQRNYVLPVDRSPFVKNDTQITLVKGVVQKVGVTRPSIVLGILGVPKTILDALVPLPH